MMRSLDEQVLKTLLSWLKRGDRAWLCTIVGTYGSSPRPAGSLFACNDRGQVAGSLSGGCVEEELVEGLLGAAPELAAMQVLEYGVTAEENAKLGLPCGGRLEVLLEPLDSDGLEQLRPLCEAVCERRFVRKTVHLSSASVTIEPAERYSALRFDGDTAEQVFGPRYRMLLVGAGALAQTLAELALAMDYEVIVCDPRQEALEQWAGPKVQRVGGMPDDAVRRHAPDRDSIVLTLTHDPRIDDMALMEALREERFYVGALGSARTSAARRERLLQLDISEAQLARLHAPVGLNIGSKTPMEIAIAILAELTQLRAAAQSEAGMQSGAEVQSKAAIGQGRSL